MSESHNRINYSDSNSLIREIENIYDLNPYNFIIYKEFEKAYKEYESIEYYASILFKRFYMNRFLKKNPLFKNLLENNTDRNTIKFYKYILANEDHFNNISSNIVKWAKSEEYIRDLSYVLINDTHNISEKYNQFFTPWRFAQLLRWVEKAFLYKNSEDNLVYSDSVINDFAERHLVFNIRSDYKIFLNLKLVENKKNPGTNNQVKEITVTREYGKKQSNKFVVVENNVIYNDNADVILYKEINKSMKRALGVELKNILVYVENYSKNCLKE